jgi:hypothetical protein
MARQKTVLITKVAKASSKSPSVRTTIPEEIVKDLGISIGDALVWEISKEDSKKIAKLRKVE